MIRTGDHYLWLDSLAGFRVIDVRGDEILVAYDAGDTGLVALSTIGRRALRVECLA